MEEKPKIKPCPFCGGEVVIDNSEDMYRRQTGVSTNGGGVTVIACTGCDYALHLHRSQVKSLNVWNSRGKPK
jgi:Lar family restriction alleviation protein